MEKKLVIVEVEQDILIQFIKKRKKDILIQLSLPPKAYIVGLPPQTARINHLHDILIVMQILTLNYCATNIVSSMRGT